MQSQRIGYLDTSKAIGMYLVYYGHFIEKLYYAGSRTIFWELKLIYAFHVPLFFFLAGIFWKPDTLPLWRIFARKFATRIMPVLFFSVLTIPLFFLWDKVPVTVLLEKLKFYYIGQPKLNWVTWFLVCLFTLEMILAGMVRLGIPIARNAMTSVYIIFFFAFGWLLTENATFITKGIGVPVNFWFLNEAFVANGFFLAGFCSRPLLEKPLQGFWVGLGLVLSGLALVLTFNLNQGPFYDKHAIVLMNASSHGNYLWFILTAFSGIVCVMFFSRLLVMSSRIVDYIGKNTLIYLGLNGVCLHFLDVKVIYKIGYFPDSFLSINLYALFYVTTVMALFIPIAWLIRRTLPKWIIP